MTPTPDIGVFLDELQREIRDKQVSLLDAEFLAAVEAGTVERERIGAWARVFYAVTRNGRFGLGNFYAHSPEDPVLRRELAENLYEEETGRISGSTGATWTCFSTSSPLSGSVRRKRSA